MFDRKIFVNLVIALCALSTFSCTYEVVPEENLCTAIPSIQLVSTLNTECGNSTGEIVVEAQGVDGEPFKFSINGENESVTGRFENLPAANYLVTVETIEGCTNSLNVEIKNQSGLNISVETVESACGSNTGKIVINVEGGEPPFSFKLDNTEFQTTPSFEDLAIGQYTILAEDASGCSVTQSVEITANVEFSAVQALIQTNCATSICHGGNVNPDFRQSSNISESAARIKSRTTGKTMPPSSSGISLTDQEIDLIACWVDSGANL